MGNTIQYTAACGHAEHVSNVDERTVARLASRICGECSFAERSGRAKIETDRPIVRRGGVHDAACKCAACRAIHGED